MSCEKCKVRIRKEHDVKYNRLIRAVEFLYNIKILDYEEITEIKKKLVEWNKEVMPNGDKFSRPRV